MPGAKRSHEEAMATPSGENNKRGDAPPGAPVSPFAAMFEGFRTELDEHHDRRERIIKASRDVTAASKKVIFTLQRTRNLGCPLPAHISKNNKPYHDTISTQLSSVAQDLQDLNSQRYARQISGGCQEWMEAASFEHYLTTGNLLTYSDARTLLAQQSTPDKPSIDLSFEDYLLGIYDMTGELMRFAITAMATGGEIPRLRPTTNLAEGEEGNEGVDVRDSERNVLKDMRALRAALEALDVGKGYFAREVEKKMDVMRESVEKVERALYGLVVRGAERPKGWMPDMDGGGGARRAVDVDA